MAIPKRNIRGLQDIRTLSGSVDQLSEPYKAFMRISCLEMEKLRRGKEKESALNRLNNIDERFQEIEVEKDVLLQTLGHQINGNQSEAKSLEPKPENRQGKEGFKITY